MTTDEKFMLEAIQSAKESAGLGGMPIGAVVVKDGQIISRGTSLVWPLKDPTNHGETDAIKKACKALGAIDLSGCTLYSTLESCMMCMSLAGWTKCRRVVFGAFKEDIPPNPYEITDYHALDFQGRLLGESGKPMQITGGVLRKESAELMRGIRNWEKMK